VLAVVVNHSKPDVVNLLVLRHFLVGVFLQWLVLKRVLAFCYCFVIVLLLLWCGVFLNY
jgi:hypothetical protein